MSTNDWMNYFYQQQSPFALNLISFWRLGETIVVFYRCFGWQVIFVAIFFAMILRPVAVEDNEEVELLLQGENTHTKQQTCSFLPYQNSVIVIILYCHFTEQKEKCEEYSGRSISWLLSRASNSDWEGRCLVWDLIPTLF